MRNVYIVNKGVHDYSAAEIYGTLKCLSVGNLKKYDTSKIYRRFKPILDNSAPEDYILLTGLQTANVVATFIMAMLHGRINLLIFRPGKGGKKEYLERILI